MKRFLRPRISARRLCGVGTLLFVAAAFFIWPLIPPPLPKKIRIGTGPADGRYRMFGERLKWRLEEQGFQVELVASAGSAENLKRLCGAEPQVDVALVQGGVADPETAQQVRGIASLFYEPIWIFHRKSDTYELVSDLKGKAIAIGRAGSGSAPLARQILAANGVSDGDAHGSRFVPLGGEPALKALHAGKVDAVFLVQAPTNQWIHDLVEDGALSLMLFERADAYAARFRYLKVLHVPRGFVDFELDLPQRDIRLLATTANLVMREETHPRLVPLLIELCRDELARGSVLAAPEVFPSIDDLDVPPTEVAVRYFRTGPSFLYRYLPFQVAHTVNRMVILLIPLLTLLYPLLKGAGPLYRWVVSRRIYPWYAVLRDLERALDHAQSPEEHAEIYKQLAELEEKVAAVTVPARFTGELFILRRHVALVRAKQRPNVSPESVDG